MLADSHKKGKPYPHSQEIRSTNIHKTSPHNTHWHISRQEAQKSQRKNQHWVCVLLRECTVSHYFYFCYLAKAKKIEGKNHSHFFQKSLRTQNCGFTLSLSIIWVPQIGAFPQIFSPPPLHGIARTYKFMLPWYDSLLWLVLSEAWKHISYYDVYLGRIWWGTRWYGVAMRGRMSVWWLSNSILHQTPKSHNGLSFRVSKKSEGLIHSKPDQMQRPIMASFSVFL